MAKSVTAVGSSSYASGTKNSFYSVSTKSAGSSSSSKQKGGFSAPEAKPSNLENRFASAPEPVATVYDPWTNSFYYVKAESISAGEYVPGQGYTGLPKPGETVTNSLVANDVDHVLVQGHTGNLNQQDVREKQEIIPGTTLERDFGSGSVGFSPPKPEAPPAPPVAAAPPRTVMPGRTAPTQVPGRTSGGIGRATGLVTGSRNSLDFYLSPDSPGGQASGLTLKQRR